MKKKEYMKYLHMLAVALVLVGGLNWGLIALFNLNLVTTLLGSMPMVEKVVYLLVGASAAWLILVHRTYCKICK